MDIQMPPKAVYAAGYLKEAFKHGQPPGQRTWEQMQEQWGNLRPYLEKQTGTD